MTNRERRRQLKRAGVDTLAAVRNCDECGAPYCPRCDRECPQCDCCGEFNCEVCLALVFPAASSS